jgi:hypothetical protein
MAAVAYRSVWRNNSGISPLSTSRSNPPAAPVIVPMITTMTTDWFRSSATWAPMIVNRASPRASAMSNEVRGNLRKRAQRTVNEAAARMTRR